MTVLGKLDPKADSRVRCTTCGYEEWVQFSVCLRRGWPKCHGATMRLESHPDIEAETEKAFSSMIPGYQKRRTDVR